MQTVHPISSHHPRSRAAVDALGTLIGFDTVSHKSNLALIGWLEEVLAPLGARLHRVPDETGQKANLVASFGPQGTAGYVLSGHTDVVPVEGQPWSSDPFRAEERDGRIYGRGSCDMKGFLACMLAAAPAMAEGLARPIHLAFSHDEEVGCLGVRSMLREMALWEPRPLGCFVGEPTLMEVVVGHKAKRSMRVLVTGRTAHSSLAPTAVNAVAYAARLIAHIGEVAAEYASEGARDALYDVPFTTPHVGVVSGGEVVNIVPDACTLQFEVRAVGADDPAAVVARIERFARDVLEPEMRQIAPEAGIAFEVMSSIDGLDTAPDAEISVLAKALAGRNAHSKVAYGTEAGFFDTIAGIPAVVIGPGSIGQAHKADEFVEIDQLSRCLGFIDRLIEHCRQAG